MHIIFGLLLFFILIIVFISYKQSDKILIRKAKYTPLAIFPSQFNLPFEEIKKIFLLKDGLFPLALKAIKP